MDAAGRSIRALAVAAAILLAAAAPAAAAISTTDLTPGSGQTATSLAQSLAGPGVRISNVRYTGAAIAAGSFAGGAPIGFDSGVLLSSGDVANVIGPNQVDNRSTTNGTPGDADLNALVAPGTTSDAAVLEFDLVPSTSRLSFSYVFSSEEYNEFVGSIDDVFAFFVNGSNCALVPGTGQPVAVNTINNGNPFGNTDPNSGTPASNPGLYRNNDLDDGGGSIDTEMDGLTRVLTCTATVNPGRTNRIKLAIADESDSSWDSAVFLQRGGFAAPPAVSIGDASADEDGTLGFPVTLSATTTTPVTVQAGTANGSATAPADYAATFATVTIPAGQTTATFSVPTAEDTADEPDEAMTATLSFPSGATPGDLAGTGTIRDDDPPPPEKGESVNLLAASGSVCYELPGSDECIPLEEGAQIPLGSTVDTRKGRVTLVSAKNTSGATQSADFYDGIFKIGQTGGKKPFTTLKLAGKKPKCGASNSALAHTSAKRKRRLWGSGRGRYRTRGRYSSATVRGTTWLTEDNCKGTLTKVTDGKVKVRDFVRDKTVTVRAGKRYLSRRP
jgi:hypothetical protein